MCFRTPRRKAASSALAPLQTDVQRSARTGSPELIDTYYQPFNFDCRDEEHPDGGPFYTRVLASVGADGHFSLRHNSAYMPTQQPSRFDECEPS